MRRFLSIFLSIAIMVTMLVVPISANNLPTVTVSSIEEAVTFGEEVEVKVSAANNPGFTNFDWKVDYDTNRLELKAFKTTYNVYNEEEEIYQPSSYISPLIAEFNLLTNEISAAGVGLCTKNGILFKLVFKVKENAPSGEAKISIISENIKSHGVPVEFNYVAGTVNVDGIDEEPDDIPSGDIPSGDIPSGDIPSGDIPSGDIPSGDIPSGDIPSGDIPSGDIPSGDIPSGDIPSGDIPSGDIPSGDIPSGDIPSGDIPSGDIPSGDIPSGDIPSGDIPSGDIPSGDIPSGDIPSGDIPSGDIPSGDIPSGDIPSGDIPSGDIPSCTEHNFVNWTKVDENNHKGVCACGEEKLAPHNWNDGVETTPATHTATGVKTFTCTDCQATKTEDIPKTTQHSHGGWENLDANNHKKVCECGDTITQPHNWNDGVETTPATHTATGVKTFTCTDCQATKTEDIPKTTEHNHVDWENVDEDNHKGTCECGDVSTQAHNWDDGVETTPATHTTTGVMTFTCTVCQATKTEDIEMVEHTFDQFDNQHCTECGYIRIVDNGDVVIEATQNETAIVVSSITIPDNATGLVVLIDLSSFEDKNVDTVQIDKAILESLLEEGNSLEIVMPDSTTIKLDADAIAELIGEASGATVSIKIVKLLNKQLTDDQFKTKKELTDAVVYRVSIVNDDDGTEIANLNLREIVITIPYEKTSSGKVLGKLLADNGVMTEVTTTYDDSAKVATLTIRELGDYIVYTKAQKSSGGGGGGSSASVTSYTVKFETNGAGSIKAQSVDKNSVVVKPAAPKKDGYTFDGWYLDKALTQMYDFDTPVLKSFTLYAKWTEIPKEEFDEDEEPVETDLTFGDVEETDWFYDAVKYVYDNKLMNGMSDNGFNPDFAATRAMLVTIMYRVAGEPEANAAVPYTDVDMNAYYANAVSWAHQNGVVNGVSETAFAPNVDITREQIVAVIYRYLNSKGYDVSVGENTDISSYKDFENVSEYAVPAMKWACGSGLIKGTADGSLNPKNFATRAEIATILYRFIGANN